MTTRKTCPKCNGAMAQGFRPDQMQEGTKASKWVEGPPDKRWYGLRLRGKVQFEIQSFRCTRCGYLEDYAPG
jgi:predicted nucleic-acid-binding Zn-ribbon protein